MHASKRLGSASMARVCPLRPCKRHKLSIFSSAMSWSRGCEGIWYISLKPVGGSNSHDSLNGRQRAAYKKGRQAAGKQRSSGHSSCSSSPWTASICCVCLCQKYSQQHPPLLFFLPATPFRFFEETLLLPGTGCCTVPVGGSGIVATGAAAKVSCGAVVAIPMGDDAPG